MVIFFKRNVDYVVGGRFFPTDATGWTMTNDYPYISVKEENLRDFKIANKRAIIEGLIVQSEPPNIDWETPNTITDEEARELVKQFLPLKQKLQQVTSVSAVAKLLDIAKKDERPPKTIKIIEARLAEISDDDEEFSERESE
jgi:hypothetical protein